MNNLSLKKNLSYEQLAIVQSELEKRKKSSVVMYLLWLFTGGIGGHRYYLGDIGIGIAMTLTLGGLGFWALLDVFFIGRRLAKKTELLEKEIIYKVKEQSIIKNNSESNVTPPQKNDDIINENKSIIDKSELLPDETNDKYTPNTVTKIEESIEATTKANEATQSANEGATLANEAAERASQEASNLDELKTNDINSTQEVISFNVTGVTFENDKGKAIQPLLRRIALKIAKEESIPKYGGWTNKEIIEYGTEVSEFEDIELGDYISLEKDPNNEYDKNAIKVIVTIDNQKYHIGHVPKKQNIEIGTLLDNNTINFFDAHFVGGKIKEIDYDFEKDKDIVVVKELTLGVNITLYVEE